MKICFVIPVYNDEASLKKLINKIDKELKDSSLYFVIVDDCSSDDYRSLSSFQKIDLVKLKKNQGSQQAIAEGLKYVKDNKIEFDYLIIMDSDGEDKPEHLKSLIFEAQKNDNKFIVFASRKKRMEILKFKFFYFFYKLVFRVLTGKKINFGNYCCIPNSFLNNIVNISFLRLHFPAAIIKSRLSYKDMLCDKGLRYADNSKMSFKSLFFHGFKAFSIFLKEIIIRLLIIIFFFNVILFLNSELSLLININIIFFLIITSLIIFLYSLRK